MTIFFLIHKFTVLQNNYAEYLWVFGDVNNEEIFIYAFVYSSIRYIFF